MAANTTNHKYRTRAKLNQTNVQNLIDSDSSEYSDWLSPSEHNYNYVPPKQRKRTKKRSTEKNSKLKLELRTDLHSATPALYHSSKWLSEVIPWKLPYFPQMGDDIVYFRQGHQIYLEAVQENVIHITFASKPWTQLNIKAHEFCKVVAIKYETYPPRLCRLKLAVTDEQGHLSGDSFSIKYYPIMNVHDFFVLRQTFNKSLQKKWMIGTKFRYMNEDHIWKIGKILAMEPFNDKFPDSYFRCYRVKWDNGDIDMLSPWDLESIDESNMPETIGGTVPALPKDIRKSLFLPRPEDWPLRDRGIACRKLIQALHEVMKLPVARDFINSMQKRTRVIEYPIDLMTIKARLDNRFYRYITSLKFDIRYIAKNAEKFNARNSIIVKNARILTDVCLEIIKNIENDVDVNALYLQFLNSYNLLDSDEKIKNTKNICTKSANSKFVHINTERSYNEQELPNTSRKENINHLDEIIFIDEPSTSAQRPKQSPQKSVHTPRKSNEDWKTSCRRVLKTLWKNEDSIPFRQPVDPIDFPDYNVIVSTPMCLQAIDEQLEVNDYKNPKQFYDDLKLIISNSRIYNDNETSDIYKKTTRWSSLIEELVKPILENWGSTQSKSKTPNKSLIKQAQSSKSDCVDNNDDDDNDIEKSSSDERDDEINDPTWEMDTQHTEQSEEFSQVVNKFSQISTSDTTVIESNSDTSDIESPVRNTRTPNNSNGTLTMIVTNDNAQTNVNVDTGFEDDLNSSDSWEMQICLDTNHYEK